MTERESKNSHVIVHVKDHVRRMDSSIKRVGVTIINEENLFILLLYLQMLETIVHEKYVISHFRCGK